MASKGSVVSHSVKKLEQLRRRLWTKIRNLDLTQDDIDTLDEDARIFRLYRDVQRASLILKELGEPSTVRRIADLAWRLAIKASQELVSVSTTEVAA